MLQRMMTKSSHRSSQPPGQTSRTWAWTVAQPKSTLLNTTWRLFFGPRKATSLSVAWLWRPSVLVYNHLHSSRVVQPHVTMKCIRLLVRTAQVRACLSQSLSSLEASICAAAGIGTSTSLGAALVAHPGWCDCSLLPSVPTLSHWA